MSIKEKLLNHMARKKGFKDYNEYSEYYEKIILPSIKNNLKARDKKIEAKKEALRRYDLETKRRDNLRKNKNWLRIYFLNCVNVAKNQKPFLKMAYVKNV